MSYLPPQPERPASLPEQGLATTSDSPRRVIVRRVAVGEDEYDDTPSGGGGCGPGCKWLAIGTLGVVAIIALLIAGLVFSGVTSLNNILGGFTGGLAAPPPQAAVVSTQTVVTSIQSMGQLVSISAQMAKADINVRITQGFMGASSFTTNHVAQGAIEAGIDLTQLTAANVSHDPLTNTYTVVLPAAQLTSCRVDYIRQYGYSGTLLPVDRDSARLLANYTALVEFRDDALEGGILNRAQEQAALVFSNLVNTLTGGQTVITFSEASPPLPQSCEPDIPGSWRYDPATQAWTQPE